MNDKYKTIKANCIISLRDVLKQAEEGTIKGMSLVYLTTDGRRGILHSCALIDMMQMVGAMEVAKTRLAIDQLTSAEDLDLDFEEMDDNAIN